MHTILTTIFQMKPGVASCPIDTDATSFWAS